jgi:hypothetical protein
MVPQSRWRQIHHGAVLFRRLLNTVCHGICSMVSIRVGVVSARKRFWNGGQCTDAYNTYGRNMSHMYITNKLAEHLLLDTIAVLCCVADVEAAFAKRANRSLVTSISSGGES